MGTRGLVGFKSQGRYVTSYNHWDSYPDGLGKDVIEFLKKVRRAKGWNKLENNVRAVELIEKDSEPSAEQIARYKEAGLCDLNVGNRSEKDWYCLLRNAQGGDGLIYIYKGILKHVSEASEFLKDSLFCEYGYVINLDTFKLDCYKGFQREPQKGNELGETANESGYYPCKLAGSFDLQTVMLKDIKGCLEDEDEEE